MEQARHKPLIPEVLGSERSRQPSAPQHARGQVSWLIEPAPTSRRGRACIQRFPFPLDERPTVGTEPLGRGVANRLRHASNDRFTVAGTAPDSRVWSTECEIRSEKNRSSLHLPKFPFHIRYTGVPFSSRPAGAGARTRSVCERTNCKVAVCRGKAQSLHGIFCAGVDPSLIRRAGDARARRCAPLRPSRRPGREG